MDYRQLTDAKTEDDILIMITNKIAHIEMSLLEETLTMDETINEDIDTAINYLNFLKSHRSQVYGNRKNKQIN